MEGSTLPPRCKNTHDAHGGAKNSSPPRRVFLTSDKFLLSHVVTIRSLILVVYYSLSKASTAPRIAKKPTVRRML